MDSPSNSNAEFEPFELDDKYVITGLIAEGGMGRVYVGETKLVKRKIAVKILHPSLVKQAEMLLRFKMEAEIASSLSHPNIVNVFGSGVSADGKAYLAMDYVEGESLESLIHKEGRIKTALCVSLFAQLARALEYTHEKGVIHRDLKPSNIMLQAGADGSYLVKLLDFGIAKSVSVEDTITRELTLPGIVFGSVYYMSPEQILGKKVDFHSDIYSYGCLLFHALTGRPPYEASSPVDCMQMHVNESIPNLADILPELPCSNELGRIISTCLLKDQSQRFESSQQLRVSIEKVQESLDALSTNSVSAQSSATSATPQSDEVRKSNIYAALSFVIIAAALSAVPFAINLNLAKAETKKPVAADGKESKDDAIAAATAQTTSKVDELLEQTHAAIDQKNLAEAEKIARTAYLSSLSLSADNPKIADSLYLLGQVFELEQNYSGASQAYNWALSFYQSKYGPMAPQTIAIRERQKALQPLLNGSNSVSAPPRIAPKDADKAQ